MQNSRSSLNSVPVLMALAGLHLSALPMASAAQSGATPLTLTEAIRYATAHSPVVTSAASELAVREFEEKNAFARFFPSLDISTRAGLQDGSRSTRSTPWVSQLDLTFSGTLYDNGETYTRSRIAELRTGEAELRYRMTRDEVCRDVAYAYFDYSLSQKQYEIRTNEFTLLKKQAELVSAQYYQGMRTRKDFLRFKSELGRIELALTDYRAQIDSAKSKLRAALGVGSAGTSSEMRGVAAASPSAEEVEFAALAPEKVDFKLVPAQAPLTSSHYQRLLAGFEVDAAEKNVDLARRRYGPELTLTAGAGYGSADYIATGTPFVTNDQTSWNVLLNLKYNLWDWGIRRHELAAAVESRKVQELARETRLLSLRSELEQLMFELDSLKKTHQFSIELLGMERTNFEFLQTEYRNGRVSYLELIDGLKNLSSAESTFAVSSFALQKKLIAYRFHEGTLNEKFCSNARL